MMGGYEKEEQMAVEKLYLAATVIIGLALYALFT